MDSKDTLLSPIESVRAEANLSLWWGQNFQSFTPIGHQIVHANLQEMDCSFDSSQFDIVPVSLMGTEFAAALDSFIAPAGEYLTLSLKQCGAFQKRHNLRAEPLRLHHLLGHFSPYLKQRLTKNISESHRAVLECRLPTFPEPVVFAFVQHPDSPFGVQGTVILCHLFGDRLVNLFKDYHDNLYFDHADTPILVGHISEGAILLQNIAHQLRGLKKEALHLKTMESLPQQSAPAPHLLTRISGTVKRMMKTARSVIF